MGRERQGCVRGANCGLTRVSPDADQPRHAKDGVHLIGEADTSIPTDELPFTRMGSS